MKLQEIDFLKQIFDSIESAIFVMDIDPDRTITYNSLNAMHERLTGFSSAWIAGKTPDDLITHLPQEIITDINAHYEECLEKEDTIQYEEMIPFNGIESWWLTRLTPIKNEHGRIFRIIGSSVPITERRKIEEDVRRNRDLLEEAQQIAHIASFEYDVRGPALFWSPEAFRLLGCPEGSKPLDLWSFLSRVPDVDRLALKAEFKKALGKNDSFETVFRFTRCMGDVRTLRCVGKVTLDAIQKRFRLIGTIKDETEEILKDERLVMLSAAVEQTASSVVITDTNGLIMYANPQFYTLTGFTPADALGKTPRILKSGFQDAGIYSDLWKTILAGKVWRGELKNRTKTGELFWESVVISPVRDGAGTITHFVGVKEDITALKAATSQLYTMATMDEMTGTLNRRTGLLILEKLIAQSHRNGEPLSIAFVDINGLKEINDTQGHAKGDVLIQTISSRLLQRIRTSDSLCRMGGDEFMAIFPNCRTENATALMEKIQDTLEQSSCSFSFGVAETNNASKLSSDRLIEIADQLMYDQKKQMKVERFNR